MKNFYKILAGLTILSLVVFVMPREAFAAVTLDTSATATSGVCNVTKTLSYTVSGANPVLIVYTTSSGSLTPTGVTWGVQSLVLQNTITSGSSITSNAWLLKAPGTGTNTITATYPSSNTCNIAAVSFNGVDQTTASDAKSTDNAIGTTDTGSVTTVTAGSIIADFITEGVKTAGLTPSFNSATKIASSSVNTSGFALSYTNTSLTPAGAYSIKWTPLPSASTNWGHNMLALCPDTGCAGGAVVAFGPSTTTVSNPMIVKGSMVVK